MTDHELESKLLAARSSAGRSPFTQGLMTRLAALPATSGTPTRTKGTTKWSLVMNYIANHKIQATLAGLALVASLSFTGYAYATGTDPVTLIQRIVKGDKIEVKYQGRTFEHGKGLTYSDAAVSAYAELNTVWDLHFRAGNAFTIPSHGIEYVGPPKITNYQYPWIGTITSIDAANVYVTRQHMLGDKLTPSTNPNDAFTIPRAQLSYYIKGEPAADLSKITGHLIEVFPDDYLKHIIGTKGLPTPVVQYFAFELTHPLKDILEADQTQKPASDPTRQGLIEVSWGDTSDLCLNNGADRCHWQALPGDTKQAQSFYFSLKYYENPKTEQDLQKPPVKLDPPRLTPGNNSEVVAFGEGLPDDAPHTLLTRNTEGRVTSIKGDTVTIKSSSGTLWTLELKSGTLTQFAAYWHTPLKVGDDLGACLNTDLADLDNRHIANTYIYMLNRY